MTSCRLLVIDDDAVSLAVISLLLGAEEFEILQAGNGEEALQMIAGLSDQTRPSVVLADLQMPGICGRDLALALRHHLPGVTLLAMSATAQDVSGYDGFVLKPLEAAALRAAIASPTLQSCQAPARAELPVLNEAVYTKLVKMMPVASVNEIYSACLEDVTEQIEAMRVANSAGDAAGIRAAAHRVKGGAGMVGAARLAAAADELERGVYRGDDIPQMLADLLSHCSELRSILMIKLRT